MGRLRSLFFGTRGSIAIEFALVAPLLLLVYLALSETASAVMSYNRLALATEAGAALLHETGPVDERDVADAVSAAFGTQGDELSVNIDCTAAAPRQRPGMAVLEVHYEMPSKASVLFGRDITLTVRRAALASGLCRDAD